MSKDNLKPPKIPKIFIDSSTDVETVKKQFEEFNAANKPGGSVETRREWFFDLLEKLYLFSGNPLWIWAAIKWCRQNEVDFPRFVLRYLGKCADAFWAATDSFPKNSDTKTVTTKILGFDGKWGSGTIYAHVARESFRRFIVDVIEAEMKKPENKGKKYFQIESEIETALYDHLGISFEDNMAISNMRREKPKNNP